MEPGIIKGEICNRNDCKGIIDEHEKDGSCSCHINPPCGYCTTDSSYCPECGWEPSDDIIEINPEVEKRNIEHYQRDNEKWQQQRDLFYKKYRGAEPIEKLEMRNEPHTHFTQIIVGVFPKGTETRESLLPMVRGTFGGRFEQFGETSFKYIAYTD